MKNNREDEASNLEVPEPPDIKPLLDKDSLECRLCEDFPVFSKNFDFHKHLVDTHFRIQLTTDLPQVIFKGKVSLKLKFNVLGCSFQVSSRRMFL